MKIDLKKGAGYVGNTLGKAAEIGKKAADNTKSGAQLLATKAQEENLKAQIKKYNPVFPIQYTDPNFGLSNVIMIVDDVLRKDIDVCEGAIGWKSNKKGVEIFHLYDEAIKFSGLHFTPCAICDAIYYVDPHDRKHFIRIDCFFDEMEKAKMGELTNIAVSLGAKKSHVEIVDTSIKKHTFKQKASLEGKVNYEGVKITESTSERLNIETENRSQNKYDTSAEFASNRKPIQPNLQWFAYDSNIKELINTRCAVEEKNGLKEYNLHFKGKSISSMSISTAIKLDAAIACIGLGRSLDLEGEAVNEHHHDMILHLEF